MRAIIVAAGHMQDDQDWHHWVRGEDLIIGADGGGGQALSSGLFPSLVIGDMDSLSPADLRQLEANGCRFIEHPRAKDETDLELALTYAAKAGAEEIIVFGALGGRLDHTLSNVLLLALPILRGITVRIVHGEEESQLLCSGKVVTLKGQPGDLVSLIPLHGDARGVTTSGLAWMLAEGILRFGSSRGVSNEMVDPVAQIGIQEGVLLVVHGPPDRG